MMRIAVLTILLLVLPGVMASSVRGAGNITLEKVDVSNSTPVVGEKVTFWVVMYSTQKYWDVKVGIYIDYKLVMVREVPYISGQGKIWFIWSFENPGLHDVTVVVDYKNTIHETNENDNSKTVVIHVKTKPLPDLIIQSVNISSNVIFAGKSFTVGAHVLSRYAPAYNIPVMFYLDGKNYSLRWIPAIPSNGSYYMWVVLNLPAGNHSFEILVNYNHMVKERNYNNDYRGITIHVYRKNAKYNIAVKSISVSNPNPVYGEIITVTATISNTGDVTFTGVSIAVLYDDVNIYRGIIPELAPGSDYLFSYSLKAYSNGSRVNTITVFADYNNKFNETNEMDNFKSVNITVRNATGGVRISPGDIFISSTFLRAGVIVTIYAKIWNTGNSSTWVSATMGVDNKTIKTFYGILVNSHSYTSVYVLWTCRAGWHQIWINVSNMSVFRTVWIKPSHAVVKFVSNSLKISDRVAYVGKIVTISAKVVNTGDAYASNVSVMFLAAVNNTTKIISVRSVNLAPGTYGYMYVLWTPRIAGNYTISVEFLPEETLNYLNFNESVSIYVKEALPDLVIQNAAYVKNNYTASIRILVGNIGIASATNFYVGVLVNGKLENKTLIYSLNPGNNLSMTMNVTLRDGNNNIKVIADYYNSVREYNESNNEYTFDIMVVPNNNILIAALATFGIIAAIVGIAGFFVYSIRRFIAMLFYGFIFSLLGMWASLRERPPFGNIVEEFHRWMRDRE